MLSFRIFSLLERNRFLPCLSHYYYEIFSYFQLYLVLPGYMKFLRAFLILSILDFINSCERKYDKEANNQEI